MGSAVSAIAATGLFAIVLRNDDEQRILSEVVSAHLRSLQAGHLTDVVSTDQHTVKPWFNGKLDVVAAGDRPHRAGLYVDRRPARLCRCPRDRRRSSIAGARTSSICSSPRPPNTERRAAKMETIQGFNIRRWSEQGMNYWAVSDLAADELTEFGEKFEAAIKGSGAG